MSLGEKSKLRDDTRRQVRIIDKELYNLMKLIKREYPLLEIYYTGSLEFASFGVCLSPEVARRIMTRPKFKKWVREYCLGMVSDEKIKELCG